MPPNILPSLPPRAALSATDQVFETLREAIISLTLPPGSKLSEAEVARQLEVSRQPVRDAFFRLSQQGFLLVRPQRATLVSKISKEAVSQASFVRQSLELACLQEACVKATPADLAALEQNLAEQKAAVDAQDSATFHVLDDAFHQHICRIAGRDFVWSLITDHKGHLERMRLLSLPGNGPRAYGDHCQIFYALRDGNLAQSERALRQHLGQILEIFDTTATENPDYFAPAIDA